jgi:hypothetical protein
MHLGVAKPRDGVQMIRRGVPFVAIEAVPWVPTVQFDHQAIPRHLGDDRRRGDS